MDYKDTFRILILELQKMNKNSVLNVKLNYLGNEYFMFISSLELGQRIEIKKNESEYVIFVTGMEGLSAEGIVHEKNPTTILKMITKIDKEVIKKIVTSDNLIHNLQNSDETVELNLIKIPHRVKTEEDVRKQIDRILDRYNDYLCLYKHSNLTDEIFKGKAMRTLYLLKKVDLFKLIK